MNVFQKGLILASVLAMASPAWAQDSEAPADAAAAENEKPAEEAQDANAPADAATDEKPADAKLGPGGRPLRTDYPGTEESLQSRMDTNQIEGLQVDGGQPQEAYQMRIQELETKIDDLKEKVFQSKTRIVLLRETLLSGNLAGARAILIHKTELGSAFKLREALYSLDGAKIFGQVDKNDSLADKRTFEFYNGTVSPGTHNLSIFLKYQGSGYGLFTYFDGYEFDIRSSCQFKAEEGKIAQIRVVAFEQGNVATSKENRPSTRCEVQYFDNIKTEEPVAQQDKP
ncbi:MAG: hypothetical protein R3E66_20795 [bacterium]